MVEKFPSGVGFPSFMKQRKLLIHKVEARSGVEPD